MPEAIVLAGPNGAGKTTAYPTVGRGAEFLNADSFAQTARQNGMSQAKADVAGMREVLRRLEELPADGRSFCLEATLSGRSLVRRLPSWRNAGYTCRLIFIGLKSPDIAVARVAKRVEAGGHHVAEAVVRQRWASGLEHLFGLYLPLFDSWRVYDNSDADGPLFLAAGEVEDFSAWTELRDARQRYA